MPPKRKNVDHWSPGGPKRQKKAPQSAPHSRGGIHRVKDEHRTGTKWDHYSRALLEQELRSRPGLYRKDLPKHVMARILVDDDRQRALGEKRKEKELQKKRAQAQKEKEKAEQEKARQIHEQQKRAAEREQRRLAGEHVSDTSSERSEHAILGIETYGHLSEDESDEPTETETTMTPSSVSPAFPHSRLRIFEWPDLDLPHPDPPEPQWSPTSRERGDVWLDPIPQKIPYAVMKLVTTFSRETLELPGRTYPDYIAADFVPKLTQHAINCARNGILVGTLRKAVIESGFDWAERTQVQWWNGQMYLHLPRRTSAVPLVDVYAEWNKRKKSKAKILSTNKVTKRNPKRNFQNKWKQGAKDKRQKMLDIYASSEYRPPICYAPVHLEYPNVHEEEDGPQALENLYFIRFPLMDLPHYFFWARPYEWDDPTVSNPDWLNEKILDEQLEHEETLQRERMFEQDQRRLHLHPSSRGDSSRPYPLEKTKMRVKQSSTPQKFQKAQKRLPKTSKYQATISTMERQLYEDGFAKVLHRYRVRWLVEGKEKHWQYLIDNLPGLYPSGALPKYPPVHQDRIPRSLAEKLASIEAPSPSRPLSPIQGDEPWTRDDNEGWDIVQAPSRRVSEAEIEWQLLRSIESPEISEHQVLKRTSEGLPKDAKELDTWLKGLSPSYAPPTGSHVPTSATSEACRAKERETWEKLFEQQITRDGADQRVLRSSSRSLKKYVPNIVSQIEDMPVTELKFQLFSLMNERLRHDHRCRICLEPLDTRHALAVHHHYQVHHDEAESQCPFCGMDWVMLDSQWKAHHIFSHDFDDSLQRRRSSTQPPLYGTPRSRRLSSISTIPQPRRPSKVQFSPNTVERRIGYNDLVDMGMEADVSSIATTSPRKSSLKRKNDARGPRLKINTGNKVMKNNTNPKSGATRGNKKNGIKTRTIRTRQPSDSTYHTPSSPSDYVSSPDFRIVGRKGRRDNSDAAWDPDIHSTSGSEHIPSPRLPHVVQYSADHPDASFNPRRASSSAYESLEYDTGRQGLKKKGNANSAPKATKSKSAKGKSKGKQKVDETEYIGIPSSASSNLQLPTSVPETRKRRKIADPTYHAGTSPSSASSPNLKKRTKEKPVRGKKKATRIGLEQQLDLIEPPPSKFTRTRRTSGTSRTTASSRKSSSVSKTSPSSKKRKSEELTSLNRRKSSLLQPAPWGEEDYIAFLDTPLLEDSKDALTGNPFAPSPKKSRAKTKGKTSKIAKAQSTKVKKLSPKEAALDHKRAVAAKDLANRRTTRSAKTTISGRPFVEPLTIAPAKRMGQASPKRQPSISMLSTTDEEELIEPPTPAIESSSTRSPATPKKRKALSARGRRSSAPTPSPSIPKPPSFPLTADKGLLKRPSYDVPCSDTRPIVPPNTPAVKRLAEELTSDSESGLDIDVLSDKIGKVKTTRAGLVRELPETVRNSVVSKGKARGRSVSKAKQCGHEKGEGKKDKVLSGRVKKKVGGKSKASMKKAGSEGNASLKAKDEKKAKAIRKPPIKDVSSKSKGAMVKGKSVKPSGTPKKKIAKKAAPKSKPTKTKEKVSYNRVTNTSPGTRSQGKSTVGKKGKR